VVTNTRNYSAVVPVADGVLTRDELLLDVVG